MGELRYIVVPYWLSNVVESNMKADYSALLSLDSMLSILSPNDVGFYLAAQKFDEFVAKVPEAESAAVHLRALTGGLLAHSYDASVLPAEKHPDVLCRYVAGIKNGYEKLLFAGPRGLGDELPNQDTPIYVEVRPVDECTIALVTGRKVADVEETISDRLSENYSRVIERLRITMSLRQVSELPAFQSYCNTRSLYHRLRRV